jgi:hypothetical protein
VGRTLGAHKTYMPDRVTVEMVAEALAELQRDGGYDRIVAR